MLTKGVARSPRDLLTPLTQRAPVCVYFLRLDAWSVALEQELWRCHEAARRCGVILDRGVPNPDNSQLTYFREFFADEPGGQPAMDPGSVQRALARWLPQLGETQRRELTQGICGLLDEQKRAGKPEGAQRSLFTKLMCWMYYRFRSITSAMGREPLPLILVFCAEPLSAHALLLLRLLSGIGADILLVEPDGGKAYAALDPESRYSNACTQGSPFPKDYDLQRLRKAFAASGQAPQQPAGGAPKPVIGRDTQPRPASAPKPVIGFGAQPSSVPPKPAVGRNEPPRPVIGVSTQPRRDTPRPALDVPQTPPAAVPDITAALPDPPAAPGAKPLVAGGRKLNIQLTHRPGDKPAASAAPEAAPGAPQLHIRTQKEKPSADTAPKKHPEEAAVMARFEAPRQTVCTNAWMQDPELDNVLIPFAQRSANPALCCNALIRLKGVRDRQTYAQDLFGLYRKLQERNRRVLVANGHFEKPDAAALNQVRRRPDYRSATELIVDTAMNLPGGVPAEILRFSQIAYAEVMLAEDLRLNNLHRLRETAVILLAMIRRDTPLLFGSAGRKGDACVILMGHVREEADEVYLRWLSRMPCDVLLFAPDLQTPCSFEAPGLLELSESDSLPEGAFPTDRAEITLQTVASAAEGELTGMLYSDSGIYRSHQFGRANAMVLQSTQDEVSILWDQPMSMRPGFATEGGMVTMPVFWTKLSGVHAGSELQYWQQALPLLGKDTVLMPKFPILSAQYLRRNMALAQKYLRDGRILAEPLMQDRAFPYALLRADLQRHLLEKAQQMLDQRLILGTFENGTEYLVVSAALSLPETMQQALQAFDFTGKNPKILAVHTGDSQGALEDAILMTLLSLAGYDILILAPTGYQCFERFLRSRLPVEHQVGPYHFDYHVPDFNSLPKPSAFAEGLKKLFRRGN